MKKIIAKARSILRKNGFDLTRHKELPEWLDLHQIDIVLDIGANDGRYAAEIREAGWKDRIVSVEPQPAAFERLTRRMGADSEWSGLQIGLGNVNSTLMLNAYGMALLSKTGFIRLIGA